MKLKEVLLQTPVIALGLTVAFFVVVALLLSLFDLLHDTFGLKVAGFIYGGVVAFGLAWMLAWAGLEWDRAHREQVKWWADAYRRRQSSEGEG